MREFPFITANQWILQTEKERRRREFRSRQMTLAALAVIHLVGSVWTGYSFFLGIALLVIQCGAVEALRFRKCGTTIMTNRSIWRGSTPVDRAMQSWVRPRHASM